MGHEDTRACLLNGPEAAARLLPKVESLFTGTHFVQARTDTSRELLLSGGSDEL